MIKYNKKGGDEIEAKKELNMDGIIKELFKISKNVVIRMLNTLFDENISNDAEIEYDDKEYIKPNQSFDKIYADIVIMVKDKGKITRYHMEYQTQYDDTIAIRLFEYGYYIAKQESKAKNDKTVFKFPNQRVIYIEENSAIDDFEEMTIIFADKQEITIRIPVIKYWEYDIQALKEKNLEALLPLQIFRFRKLLDSIVNSKMKEEEKEKLAGEKYILLKKLLTDTVAEMNKCYEKQKISGADMGVMQSALEDLWEYLISRYARFEDFRKEDFSMVIKKEYNPDYMKAVGKLEGMSKVLLVLITNRFGVIPEGYEEKLKNTNDERLEEIAKNFYSLNKIDDINKWLN